MTEQTTFMKTAKPSCVTAGCLAAFLIMALVSVAAPVASVRAQEVQEARQPPGPTPTNVTPAASNSYDHYINAGKALFGADQIFSLQTPTEKEAFLEKNAGALSALRLGLAGRFRRPAEVTFTTMFPYYSNFRALARLLVLEGQVKESWGDGSGAINSYLDAVQFGTEIQREGMIIDLLVGNAIEAVGRKPLWSLISRLEAGAARAAARRMESLEAASPSFAEVLRAESRFGQEQVRANYANNPVAKEEEVMGEYARLMGVEIADAQRPYITSNQIPAPRDEAVVMAGTGNADEGAPEVAPTAANIVQALFKVLKPVINTSRFQDTKNHAQNAMLTVALALHAYKLERGSYPDTLAQLVPEYLNRVPTDPFARQEPLLYKRDGNNYILYSIGPDGQDDGGQAFTHLRQPAPRQGNVQANSKGDIVASVDTR